MMNNTRIDQSSGRGPTGETNIERIVMRRVHLIRVLGLVISTGTLAMLTLVLALWGIGKEVWVARVFQNTPADFAHLPNFFLAAFANTSVIVQALTLLTLASFAFLVREVVRVLSNVVTPSRT